MGYSLWDRIKDKLNLNRESLTHIGIAVGIAVIISAIILLSVVPRKADISRIDMNIAAISGTLYGITELGPLATAAQIQGISNKIANQTGNITSLNSRINGNEERINAVVADLEDIVCSPPEGYLTGTFGDYSLHVRTSEACDFTANVHLVYSRAFGYNGTYEDAMQYFYSGINWAKGTPSYATVVTFNGTAWRIREIWFNIGTFSLAVHGEMTIDITHLGLNSTYEPDFAYVEVYPVLKNK